MNLTKELLRREGALRHRPRLGARTTLLTGRGGRARRCRVCRETLHTGINWRPRHRPDRPTGFVNGTICTPCERAAAGRYATKVQRRFTFAKYQARRRGHAWGLSFKTFARLLAQPCAFCGGALSPTGTGLDRIREGIGYRASNVLPACGACHRLRGFSLTPAEVRLIVDRRKAAQKEVA